MTVSTEAEVAEAIRGANGPLRITGGGTRGMAPDALEAQLQVKDVFDPGWLLNPAKVFPLSASASRRG